MLVETSENPEGTIVKARKYRFVAVTPHIHVGSRVEIRRKITSTTAVLTRRNKLSGCCIEECSLDTNEDGSSIIGAEKKSPGRRSVVPYAISADVHDRSFLRVARIPRRTIGRSSTHLLPARHALWPVLRCMWNLSTRPFPCGWYAVMRRRVAPTRFMRECQRSDSNCCLWSGIIVVGTPFRCY